ncbi:hypothetical protein [Xanthomonas albilineans]|uniref:hypothetical protein n=1 Tax=Xanthomonas albilineans TaxID=29447 RepID=UPI0011B01E2F|nr:hypothetical protein [Xanthomonas albilineans]
MSDKSTGKMKVLALQELEGVSGGGLDAWSTQSAECGGVTGNQWSTISRACRQVGGTGGVGE